MQMQPTPSQLKFTEAHKARQARISARAIDSAQRREELQREARRAFQTAWQILDAVEKRAKEKFVDVIETHLKVADIQRHVAQYYGLSSGDLCSPCRTGALIIPRHIAMYLCREIGNRSFPEIGRRFGGRDHTVSLYAHRKIAALMRDDAGIASTVAYLAEKFGGLRA